MNDGCTDLLNFLDNGNNLSTKVDPNVGLGVNSVMIPPIEQNDLNNVSTIVNFATDDYKIASTFPNGQLVTDISPVVFSDVIADSEVICNSQQDIELDHDYIRRSVSSTETLETDEISNYTDSISSPADSDTLYESQYKRETTSPMSSVSDNSLEGKKSPLNSGIEDVRFNEMEFNSIDFSNVSDEDILQSVLNDANISLDLDTGIHINFILYIWTASRQNL